MASKLFYHDIDLLKVGTLKDARINPLTTSARTTLGSGLGAGHKGLAVFDTDENKIYYWSGSAWVSGVDSIAGAMSYQGTHSSLTTAPSSSTDGEVYVLTSAGTLTWAGITFNPSAEVQVGDLAIRRSSTVYDIVQGNSVTASESTSGTVELATQSETNTGTDDVRAITPLKLTTFASVKKFAKTYFASGVSLTADTQFTVSHNLALQNKDSFVISVKDSNGSEVSVDVDSVDVNSCTVTSGVSVSSFTITVIGF